MATELFLQEARSIAVAIGTALNWFGSFTVGLAFPYILVRKGRGRNCYRGLVGSVNSVAPLNP